MFDVLPGNTTGRYAPLADSAVHSFHGEQRSSHPMDARDSVASTRHAIPCWQYTPRRSTAFAVESAMPIPDASVTVDATTGIMSSPACRNHPIPAPKIGSSTATPHKTLLQIMRPTERQRDRLVRGGVGKGLVSGIAVALHDAAIAVRAA